MNYISAEEFSSQPKEVQERLLNWWKKNTQETDLVGYIGSTPIYQRQSPWIVKNVDLCCLPIEKETIPLFTEGQLRNFIEYKTEGKFYIMLNSLRDGYVIIIDKVKNYRLEEVYNEEIFETDLLKVYWKIACDIAMK